MAKMTLFTIPQSPYCEKARWALDLSGREYREQRYPVLFHRGPVRAAGGGKTVPFLVLENGKTLDDSDDILKWVNEQLKPEDKIFPEDAVTGPLVRDFCVRVERDFAPEVVRFFYHPLSSDQFFRVFTAGSDHSQIQKFKYIAWAVRLGFNWQAKINNDGFKTAVKRIGKFYETVDHLLSDGRKYLFCDRITAADIVFCTFAANTILVPEFGGSSILLDECPPAIAMHVAGFRKSKVGFYVQAIYKRFRNYRF